MVVTAIGFYLMTTLSLDFNPWLFWFYLFIIGVGMGLFASPNSAAIMNALPAKYRGVGSGMRATFTNAGSMLSMGVFFSIILPLLRPAIITVIVTASVGIYNDFTGPLYFLPGSQNVTAQLTLFGFISQFSSQWNLLFADVVVITIPPLIMFMFFQQQIVSGTTAGAIKG